jgi:dTDP-4-amino-4,6-dideoxygalactose transaminase
VGKQSISLAPNNSITLELQPSSITRSCNSFSFCQDKIITTGGEGGLLVLDREELWKRAWAYKDHGKSYDTVFNQEHPPGFHWLHESFGSNWRMTEMQATIGCIQLNKLPDWLAARRRNATNLHALLADTPGLRLPRLPIDIEHAYYRYYAFLEPEQLAPGWSQMRILENISSEGVPCSVGSCGEIYREQAFIRSEFSPVERLPNSKQLSSTSLAFLVHPTLSESEIVRTAEVVRDVMMQAAGTQ